MNREIKILFIEDDPGDKERYEQLLSETGKIGVASIFPPKNIQEIPLTPSPDIVLIDYRLTKKQPSGISAPYRGGTIANYIREQLPNTPLITFSTRDVLSSFPNYEEEIRAVDHVLYKSDVNSEPLYWKNFLVAFAKGFRTLAELDLTQWKDIMQLLKASSSEEEDLQRSSPPRIVNGKSYSAHALFKWIFRVLFRYPGIFYDSLYASACLGIDEQDFLREDVQLFFKDAIYSGVFANVKNSWWRDRLQEIALRCIRDCELPPIISENFMIAYEKKTGRKLNPSICVFSKEKNADTVCCILKKPVKMKYTLGYLIDDRPESMDPARISFQAIREEDIDEDLIPLADAERLSEIRGIRKC